MKNKVKGFALGVIVTLIVMSLAIPVLAAVYTREATLTYKDIKITLDGQLITPTDANGNVVEPFVIDGTTYLPVRAVANALGVGVDWDSATNTVVLFSSSSQASATTPPSTSPAGTTPPSSSPAETTGQKNALATAKNYLSIMPFSYSGLIKQLEYEKYTHEDAVYAADNCGADWNEQAAKKAKSYLEIMSYSRDGLITQLEYEGFSNEQAVYGVEANGY